MSAPKPEMLEMLEKAEEVTAAYEIDCGWPVNSMRPDRRALMIRRVALALEAESRASEAAVESLTKERDGHWRDAMQHARMYPAPIMEDWIGKWVRGEASGDWCGMLNSIVANACDEAAAAARAEATKAEKRIRQDAAIAALREVRDGFVLAGEMGAQYPFVVAALDKTIANLAAPPPPTSPPRVVEHTTCCGDLSLDHECHDWVLSATLGAETCRRCGVGRRAKNENRPCQPVPSPEPPREEPR
jgi:hypothetical protein